MNLFDDRTLKGKLIKPAILLLAVGLLMVAAVVTVRAAALFRNLTSQGIMEPGAFYTFLFENLITIAVSCGIFLIAAYFILSKLYSPVITPLQDIANSIRNISKTDERFLRQLFKEDDEIGMLTESFKEVVQNIGSWEKSIERERGTGRSGEVPNCRAFEGK